MNRVLRVAAYGCNVEVEASEAGVLEILDRHLLPTLPRVQQFAGEPQGMARIEAAENGYVLSAAGIESRVAPSVIELVPFVTQVVDEIVMRHLRGWFAIHAGTVAWRGRAILVPGTSHAGKSSLVAALLRRGATYFSDEYALIDADGQAHPYPRPLLLRDGSAVQKPVLASDLNAKVGREPVPVGWIFAVKYRPGTAWKVEAMQQSEAVLNLLQNTPQILAETPEMLSHFGRAVQGSKCYRGERGSAEDGAAEILQMASE